MAARKSIFDKHFKIYSEQETEKAPKRASEAPYSGAERV